MISDEERRREVAIVGDGVVVIPTQCSPVQLHLTSLSPQSSVRSSDWLTLFATNENNDLLTLL